MTFEEWFKNELPNTYNGVKKEKLETFVYQCSESAWNHQQEKIDHIREYIVSGLQVAPKNSEYWLALRDCLNELDGIVK